MLNELLLISGNDIPFSKARLTIHQPTLKEIGYIGDETFFMGCELLNFSKNVLSSEDKSNLTDKSNFEVFMSILQDKRTKAVQKNRVSAMMVLSIIFPGYKMTISQDNISFKKETDGIEQEGSINNDNFEDFKDILVQIFCLGRGKEASNYNPKNDWANKIAEKLKKGHEKIAKDRGEVKHTSIFSRYISILAVGQYKTFQELLQYTVYQIYDEFDRFELKYQNDAYFDAKLAGAKDLKEVDNWMKDLHSDES